MIKFHDNGTVELPINGKSYTLRRANIAQLFELWDLLSVITAEFQEHLQAQAKALAEVEDDDSPEAQALIETLQSHRTSFDHLTLRWLRQAFDMIGSAPLPEEINEAPAEIADPKLPRQIIEHLRTVPLASGGRGQR